jgi:hypothetical protein
MFLGKPVRAGLEQGAGMLPAGLPAVQRRELYLVGKRYAVGRLSSFSTNIRPRTITEYLPHERYEPLGTRFIGRILLGEETEHHGLFLMDAAQTKEEAYDKQHNGHNASG